MTQEDMSLTVFDPMKAINADIIAKDAAQDFDPSTAEGEKALRSWVHRIRGHKGDLERCRVAANDGASKYIKQVNGIARDLTAEVQTVIDVRMKPLDDIAEAKRVAAEAEVAAEEAEAERLRVAALAELKEREAEVARKEQIIIDAEEAVKAKQDAADKIIREKKIADDAAEDARKQAEDDKAEALEEAEREKQAAIDAEKEKASLIEVARINKEAAEKAEAKRVADNEAIRVANQSHRADVEKKIHEVLFGIITYHVDDSEMKSHNIAAHIVTAIKENSVPNVTINY